MNILYFTDVHGTAKNPSSRLDIFYLTSLKKMYEAGQMVIDNNIDVVIIGGDLFHTPKVSFKYLGDIANIIKSWGVPVYIVPGNHDIYGYDISTIEQTALGLLAKSKVITLLTRDTPVTLDIDFSNESVCIEGQEYYSDIDKGNATDYEIQDTSRAYHLLVAHGFIIDRPFMPGVPVTEIKDIVTDADLVLSGHYHNGFKEVVKGKTTFINPGSTMRVDSGDTRMPQAVVIKLEDVGNSVDMTYTYIPFKTAKPASDVFDLSLKVAKKNTANSLALFKTTIQNTSSLQNAVTIPDMIAAIALSNTIDSTITAMAMKYIGVAQSSAQDKLPEVKGFIEKAGRLSIDSVELHNFQSHTDTTINFVEGLNILTGESNSGKTSVIRGIIWCLYNDPKGSAFITSGEKDCYVKVQMSDGSYIKRERTLTSAGSYEIMDEKGVVHNYSGFNNDIPVEVTNIHQSPEVFLTRDLKVKLNVSSQLDTPFLVGESPIAKASAVGRLIGVEAVDDAIRNIGKDVLGYTKDIKSANKIIDNNTKELVRFDNLPDIKFFIHFYQSLIDLEDSKQLDLHKVETLKSLHENNENEIKNNLLEAKNIPYLDATATYINASQQLYNEIKELDTLLNYYIYNQEGIDETELALSGLPALNSYSVAIESMDDAIAKLLFIYQAEINYTLNNKQAALLKGYIENQDTSVLDKSINYTKVVIKSLELLTNIDKEYTASNDKILMAQKESIEIEKIETAQQNKINSMKTKIADFLIEAKLCPTCGTELSKDHINKIIDGEE